MIVMVVGNHQVIDSFYAGAFGGGGDAVCIPPVMATPAGIDEHGFARRRDQQGGLPALDIHEIDFQVLGGRQQARRRQEKCGQQ